MREIRPLNETHVDAYASIAYNAYPSFKDFSEAAMNRYKATVVDIMRHDDNVEFFGLFEGETLITVARFFRFRQNCFGRVVPTGGLGFLGVHLLYKKQNAARPMVAHFEAWCRKNGMAVGLLLPFRHDYYKKQGYGFGCKLSQYRIATAHIPAYSGGYGLRYILPQEHPALLACHSRYVAAHHGMIEKIGDEIRNLREDEFGRIVGCFGPGGQMEGYLYFTFQNGKAGNYTINHIQVNELIYETPEALSALLGFLHKQQDQVQLVIFDTGDEAFHYLFNNPLSSTQNYRPFGNLESNTQYLGVMYKVFSLPEAFTGFAYRNFGGASLCARFEILSETGAEVLEDATVRFTGGTATLESAPPDITVRLRRSDFSSLFMGCVSVQSLYALGRLTTNNPQRLPELNTAFHCEEKPFNNTDF